MAEKTSDLLRPLEWHGVTFYGTSGDDVVSDCPFCGKTGGLVANTKTGKWTCHTSPDVCGRTGNVKSFMHQLWKELYASTSDAKYEGLASDRSIPAKQLQKEGAAWHASLQRWVIPSFDAKNKVHDLRAWKKKSGKDGKKSLQSTAKVPGGQALWGANYLATAAIGCTVWICEGEWDAIALRWLLDDFGRDADVVIGVTGAGVLKPEWLQAVKDKQPSHVIVCGDNDADGDRMAEKWWTALEGKNVSFLNWSDSLPAKFDIRDFIVQHKKKKSSKQIFMLLKRLIGSKHRRMPFTGQDDTEAAATGERVSDRRIDGPIPKMAPVISAFNTWLEMTDDLRLAVRACLAVHVSAPWPGDPLWMFLVGPPASGKSEILMSFSTAPDTVYQSSVNRESLLSGFSGAKDPSLIPRLIGKCGVFKDWTEMLDCHPIEMAKSYAVLRGFYDGRVDKVFGNAVSRNYIGRCSILAGVTNDIYKATKASLGERFLKFQLPRPNKASRQAIIEAAILGVTHEKEKDTALQSVVAHFLDRDRVPAEPRVVIPPEMRRRIHAISELIGTLRQSVEWANPLAYMGREVAVRPDPEMPTRLAKQLAKMAIADCAVRQIDVMDESTWMLIERMAFNTANGFNLDVVEGMMALGGTEIEIGDLVASARMHRGTLDRRIESLNVLGITHMSKVSRRGLPGGPKLKISVAAHIRKWWEEVKPVKSHVHEAIDARRAKDGFEGDER